MLLLLLLDAAPPSPLPDGPLTLRAARAMEEKVARLPDGKEADALREQAIRTYERLLGKWDHRAVDARLDLAESLARRKWTTAQQAALREALAAMDQAEKLHGKAEPDKAVPLARRALAAFQDVLGARHPECAKALHLLALLQQGLGEYPAALAHSRDALAINKEALGPRHLGTARSLHQLGELLRETGDRRSAFPLFRQALAIVKEVRGDQDRQFANTLNSLGQLLYELGDLP
ncbi:MAG: tetratricopeptide repeat protein, partial [Gemmataceae bacterium]|nr:tetratricopeptide repeat protein [Gemmataceae bacterium]